MLCKGLNFIDEICTKYKTLKNMFFPKISITLEINNIENKALKNLIKTIEDLEIKTIKQTKNQVVL